MSYQKCPVCKGAGLVSGGFFSRAGDYNTWESNHITETCKPCEGTGLIDKVTGLPPAKKRIKEKKL